MSWGEKKKSVKRFGSGQEKPPPVGAKKGKVPGIKRTCLMISSNRLVINGKKPEKKRRKKVIQEECSLCGEGKRGGGSAGKSKGGEKNSNGLVEIRDQQTQG